MNSNGRMNETHGNEGACASTGARCCLEEARSPGLFQAGPFAGTGLSQLGNDRSNNSLPPDERNHLFVTEIG